MTLVASVTLGTALVSFTSFILITRLANWEPTLMAGYKQLPVLSNSDLVPANPTQFGYRLAGGRPLLPKENTRKTIRKQIVIEKGRRRSYLAVQNMHLVSGMGTGNKACHGV